MRFCSVFTAPPGVHICLKCASVFTHPVGYRRSSSTVNETCNKDKGHCTKKILSVHILQAKIGCTPVRLTWEDHLLSLFHSEEFDEQASITSLPVLGCCSVHELRGIWLSDLVFPGLSVALGQSDNENLCTVLISIHPHHHRSPRAYHEFSTFVRWLSYVDIAWLVGLVNSSSSEISEEYGSPRACLSTLSLDKIAGWWSIPYGSHRSCLSTLSLDTVEDVMVGEVDELEEDVGWSISCLEGVMDVEEGKLEGGVVDKLGTIMATCFTCNRRRKSACWTNSWQVFPNIFRSNFGEDLTDLCIDCVDVQWLFALVVGGNPSDYPRRSSWTSPRTWMIPYQVGCSENLISSNKFNCLSAVSGIVTKLDEIISFALSFTMWNSDASILSTCSRSATIRVPFQTSLPRTRRIRGVFRVMLCSRIGGISIGQKQKWSDIHSNEQNKILWLNWFVEAPFLRYFSQIVAIHHGIHPPSSGQLQQLRKGSFLYSAYRYSAIPNLFERWRTFQ